MKIRASNPFSPRITALAALLIAPLAYAADGTWSVDADGAWNLPDNWSGGTIATGSGSTAFFTQDITDARVVTLGENRIIGNITFTDSTTSSNDLTISGANILTLSGTPLIDVTQDERTLTIASEIAGSNGLQKSGPGILALPGANTYTGTTVIDNGILAISNSSALGSSITGATTIAATGAVTGPQLALSGNISPAENITLTGATETSGFQPVILNSGGTNTLSGDITMSSPSAGIRIGALSGQLTLSGTLSQTGTTRPLVLQAQGSSAVIVNNAIANNGGALQIFGTAATGTGTVTLKAASGIGIGATTVSQSGTLKLGVADALKTTANLTLGAGSGAVGNDTGTFDLAGFDQTIKALVGTKNTNLANASADSSRIVTNSAASGTSTITVGNDNGTGVFNGVILDGATAAVALTKTGTGTQTLAGDSNYSGITALNKGTLVITHSNALGSTAEETTIDAVGDNTGGLLQISGDINSAENITINGAITKFGRIIDNTSGTNTLSGNIALDNSSGTARIGATSGQLTLSGNITTTSLKPLILQAQNPGSLVIVNNALNLNGGSLTVYGLASGTTPGAVQLSGVSGSGIGVTNVSQKGTLKLGVTNALNTTANLTVGTNSTTLGNDVGTFDLAGSDQTINALVGTKNSSNASADTSRIVTNSAASGTSTLTVGSNNGSGTFNGVIIDGATAKVALIKTGTGTQTLAGVNTYSGNTTVSGGTLVLANPNANNQASTVTIAATGAKLQLTFAGSDTVEKLFIGTTQQEIGQYGHSDSLATNGGLGVGALDAYFAAGSGILDVTTGPATGGYAAWQAANGTDQAIDLDHDGDGVANGIEYFLGGNTSTTGFTPLPGVSGNSVTWIKAASGYDGAYTDDFVVQTSTSLTAGSWTAAGLSLTPAVPGTVYLDGSNVTYTFPSGTKNFARLKVTGP